MAAKTRFRTGISRGLGPDGRVDTVAHIIYGVSVATPGEAKGHGVHIDEEFTSEVTRQGQLGSKGRRSRFGHPSMSANALGSHLGRVENFRNVDGVARGDLHLHESSAITPNGDLRSYVEGLATEDPDALGMSIVFTPGKNYRKDEAGAKVLENHSTFEGTPGPDYVECLELAACDVVDDPAANDGMFDASGEMEAGVVSEFLDSHPEIWKIADENPDAMLQFFERYKAYQNKQIALTGADTTETLMEGTETDAGENAEETTEETPETETETTETPETEVEADAELDTGETRNEELARIHERFGSKTLAAAVTDDLDFAGAQALHLAEIEDRLERLESGDIPDGDTPATGGGNERTEIPKKFRNLGDELGRFASGAKLKK